MTTTQYVPEDIILNILTYATHGTCVALSRTCKLYNKIHKYQFNTQAKFNTIKLKYSQFNAVNELMERAKTHEKLVLQAVMAYGKSISALYYIYKLNPYATTAIIVPPTVLKTWLGELVKLNLYHSNPEKSEILIYHNIRPRHYNSIDNVQTVEDIFLKHRVFITSTKNAKYMKGNVDLLVQDEVHHRVYCTLKFKHRLGLTAEQTNDPDESIVYAGFTNREVVPETHYHWHVIDCDNRLSTYETHINEFIKNKDEFIRELLGVIRLYSKTCIFLDNGRIGGEILDVIEKLLPEYKVFFLKSSLQAIQSHLKYAGKSILFLTSNTNEGLNLLVDNIILIKPDIYGATRLKQTVGRILRPNNPNKHVHVHFITNGKLGMLKILFGVVYSHPNWTFPYDDSPSRELLLKSETIARLLGYEDILNGYDEIDFCIIFDNPSTNNVNNKAKIDWYYKNYDSKSTLVTKELLEITYGY